MSEKNAVFSIDELDCAEEVRQLRGELASAPGIVQLEFDVVGGRMYATYDDQATSPDEILRRIGRLGMRARLAAGLRQPLTPHGNLRRGLVAATAGLLTAAGFAVHAALDGALAALGLTATAGAAVPLAARLLYTASIALGAWYVAPKAWFSLRQLRADMNLLMCLAVAGAMLLGQWFEAAVVTLLFNVALLLEHWSMGRARRAISSLMELSPPTARVIDVATGQTEDTPVERVRPPATVVVHPGEKIPLDGVITSGASPVNQAPITGESLPVDKSEGDEVFAGTINGSGMFQFRVTRAADDTTLARIVNMVQQAHARRAPTQQWVETFASYYTPAMIALAIALALVPPLLFAAAWTSSAYNALVLLVIACPCALVISTPVSIVSALTAAANHGVLIKGGRFLEAAARIRAVAIDKTGTLTVGKPVVQQVVPLDEHSDRDLLQRAAAMEAPSAHPIAQAILRRAHDEGVPVAAVEDYRALAGRGAEGAVDGRAYWIGSHRLMVERMPEAREVHEQSAALERAGHSVVAVGNARHVCGLISVSDAVRREGPPAVEALRQLGVARVVMLTGDNHETARAIGDAVGIDEVFAELLPEDKVQRVAALQREYQSVAMVGDGINDSPAMAAATLGIAMGVIGSDAAIEAADVALMSDDLNKLPWLIALARRSLRVIQQNIALALGLKLLFVALTLLGAASLWSAIAADMGASLLVIFNGMRLLRGP